MRLLACCTEQWNKQALIYSLLLWCTECDSQGCSQNSLKGGSSTSIELLEAGVWGRSPQPLRDFQYFNKSKLSKLLYFMQKVH